MKPVSDGKIELYIREFDDYATMGVDLSFPMDYPKTIRKRLAIWLKMSKNPSTAELTENIGKLLTSLFDPRNIDKIANGLIPSPSKEASLKAEIDDPPCIGEIRENMTFWKSLYQPEDVIPPLDNRLSMLKTVEENLYKTGCRNLKEFATMLESYKWPTS